ncbi:MAG: hypothetical protein R3F62_29710 [Planctomycetota bacterium]
MSTENPPVSEEGALEDDTSFSDEAPALEPRPTRFFEDATELLVKTIEGIEPEELIGWAHDRVDPDTMGANAILWYILREKFGKRYSCFYSKRMSFLMNRTLSKNFMPNGVLRRCEITENLSEIAHKSPLIIVLDATCPEIMLDFQQLLKRSKQLREKPILFFDHHRKGESDIEDLPNAKGIRYENAQATTSILLHVMLNLGLDLRGHEEGFRLAVIAQAGIETDLIGVDPEGYSESTRSALDYLDLVLGERGHEILHKLKSIKHPLTWTKKLGQALAHVEQFDSSIAVVGLGVIDDTGIVPFVANQLLKVGPFKTTIVFGLVFERVEGQIVSVDLDASGRSSQDTEVVLPDLFHEVFFVTSPDGRKTSKGGGRANMLLGDYSGAGASVPLDYWRQLNTGSADEKIEMLARFAWPVEFYRLRTLLETRVHALKRSGVVSVDPIDGLEGI